MTDEPTREHPGPEPPQPRTERLLVWREPAGWHWRITTVGRQITGQAPDLPSALEDLLAVALAHGLE